MLEFIIVLSPFLIISDGPSITCPISAKSWSASVKSFSKASLFAGLIVTINLLWVSENKR